MGNRSPPISTNLNRSQAIVPTISGVLPAPKKRRKKPFAIAFGNRKHEPGGYKDHSTHLRRSRPIPSDRADNIWSASGAKEKKERNPSLSHSGIENTNQEALKITQPISADLGRSQTI